MLTLYNDRGEETSIESSRVDNVVVVKRKLGDIIYAKGVMIELYDGDDKLNDNFYIPNGKSKLKYIIKEDSNDIILKVAPNYLSIPQLLQVDRDENLHEFKEKLQDIFTIDRDIAIFMNNIQLDDLKTIEENKLFDESEITICIGDDRCLTLTVIDIALRQETIEISCFINDTISEVKAKICEKIKKKLNDGIALFTNNDYLKNETRLIDYSMTNGTLIFYVDLFKENQVEITQKRNNDRKLPQGTFAKTCYGIVTSNKKEVLLKKYLFKDKNIRNFKLLQNEIIALLKLKDEPRFVQLESMFEEAPFFCIALERMQSSVKDFIPISDESLIIKYSIQILECLIHLHALGIMYRNLKCSSVLLDRKDNVKLCNFHMSKYLTDRTEKTLLVGIVASQPIYYNWAAVEMIAGENYNFKVDSWSFGATLIEMITDISLETLPFCEGEKPYHRLDAPVVKSTILSKKTIEYEHPEDISKRIEDIIALCLEPMDTRPSAAELLKKFKIM